jgi:hypothetical protein
MITESDALWRHSTYCIFCKETLVPHEKSAEAKKCPLGHGCAFVFDLEYDGVQTIMFEPAFLVFKRERPSPWLPEGIFEKQPTLDELDVLWRLLSHCVMCGDILTVDPDMAEIKSCPIGHGIAYVYDNGDDQQVVSFEPGILILEEAYDRREKLHNPPVTKDQGPGLKTVNGVKMLPADPNLHPGMVYMSRGCLVPDWALFPQPSLTRPLLPFLERLEHKDVDLYGADPNCDHYITYKRYDGVICTRCGGWFVH